LAVFSSDGRCIISSGSDGRTVLIWSAVTGARIRGPVDGPPFIPLLRNGKRLLSDFGGLRHQIAKLWDEETGQAIPIALEAYYSDLVALSHDGMKVFTQSGVRDVVTGNTITGDRAHHDGAHLVAYSPNGEKIIVADATGGRLDIWHGERLIVHLMHDCAVESLAFSPDGKRFVLGLSDGKIIIQDSDTGNIVSKLDHFRGDIGRVSSIAFSPDGKWIVSGLLDRTIRIWDAQSGASLSRLINIRTVTFSPDGQKILSTSNDCTIRVWSFQHENKMHSVCE
jgi:WD40 repeat protein